MIGMALGAVLGLLLGWHKDQKFHAQMREQGYCVRKIVRQDDGAYLVVISDRNGWTQTIPVPPKTMTEEGFQPGDAVYLDEDGVLEQIYEKDEQ